MIESVRNTSDNPVFTEEVGMRLEGRSFEIIRMLGFASPAGGASLPSTAMHLRTSFIRSH